MPDLSKRRERYVTVAVTAIIAGSFCYFGLGIRLNTNPHASAEQGQLNPTATATATVTASASAAAANGSAAKPSVNPPETQDCASFPDQEAAQIFWNEHRTEYPTWDGNHNGVVCEQLKSLAQLTALTKPKIVYDLKVVTPTEPKAPVAEDDAAPAVKPTAPSKATILATKHMFGLDTATPDEATSLESTLARQPQVQGYFQGWDTDFRPNNVNTAWSEGQLPFLTWESRPLSTTSDLSYTLSGIAAGTYDAYIKKYADDIVANGLPLMIRFDQEMNGDWYRWGETNTAADNPVGSYIAAWRHIHDIFQAEGANQLVIWNWSPNRVDGVPSPIGNYYPGDSYVDLVGMSGYYRYGDESWTFPFTYGATLAALRQTAPGKPIFISEVGATENLGHKVNFINAFFGGLNQNPDIIGFAWFNYAVTSKQRGTTQTNDWRINSSTTSTNAVRAGLYSADWGLPYGKKPVWGPASWVAPATTQPATPTATPPATPSSSAPVSSTSAPASTTATDPSDTITQTVAPPTGSATGPTTAASTSTATGP